MRLCPHCSSRRAHCRTHGRAASWLRVLPAPPAAPAVAGVPRHRNVPAQPRTAAAVKHLRGRAVPSRALASPNRGADRPVILGGAANSGPRRTPSASGCGRAAPGARTYRFGLNLSAAPPPSRRRDCARRVVHRPMGALRTKVPRSVGKRPGAGPDRARARRRRHLLVGHGYRGNRRGSRVERHGYPTSSDKYDCLYSAWSHATYRNTSVT